MPRLRRDLIKTAFGYLRGREGETLVDARWLEASGLPYTWERKGRTLVWANPDHVPSRLREGYDLVYEHHPWRRVRCRIVRDDGLVLLAKPVPTKNAIET